MIDIDKCMQMYNDNRNWYVVTYNPPAGKRGRGLPSAEEELINRLYAEVKRLREGIKSLAENIHDDMRGKYMIDALMELIE